MLKVRLLGRVCAWDDEACAELSPASCELLAFLALTRFTPQPREVVQETLWCGSHPERARRRLNSGVWRLRRTLAEITEEPCIESSRDGTIALSASAAIWVDVEAFDTAAKLCKHNPDQSPAALEDTLRLYGGELLQGSYSDFVLPHRARLAQLHGQIWRLLLVARRQAGDNAGAIAAGERLLAEDPLREDVHRDLIELHAANGDRSQALGQFARCAELLRQELGIDPLPETVRAAALAGGTHPQRPTTNGPADLAELVADLETARCDLSRTREEIGRLGGVIDRALFALRVEPELQLSDALGDRKASPR